MNSTAAKKALEVFNDTKTLFIRPATPTARKRGADESDTHTSSSDDDEHHDTKRTRLVEWVASSSSSSSSSSFRSAADEAALSSLYRPDFEGKPNHLSVVDYIQHIPSVNESLRKLKSKPTVTLTKSNVDARRIINALQGEVAHATPEQVDILVSDRATTCHILALRSTRADSGDDGSSSSSSKSSPSAVRVLASIAHIDQPAYESCIQSMMDMHKRYHGAGNKIIVEVHLVGGFNDERGSSQKLTEHLLHTLELIDRKEKQHIDIIIKTFCVSGLNDDGSRAPIGRGLAIDIASGDVFLASVDETVAGPAVVLRNCRLWSAPIGQSPRLCSVHTPLSNHIAVHPFDFEWNEDFMYLCSLTDEELLEETSTSPSVEQDDYCDQVRESLAFMKDHNVEDVFGPDGGRKVLYFERSDKGLTN